MQHRMHRRHNKQLIIIIIIIGLVTEKRWQEVNHYYMYCAWQHTTPIECARMKKKNAHKRIWPRRRQNDKNKNGFVRDFNKNSLWDNVVLHIIEAVRILMMWKCISDAHSWPSTLHFFSILCWSFGHSDCACIVLVCILYIAVPYASRTSKFYCSEYLLEYIPMCIVAVSSKLH